MLSQSKPLCVTSPGRSLYAVQRCFRGEIHFNGASRLVYLC